MELPERDHPDAPARKRRVRIRPDSPRSAGPAKQRCSLRLTRDSIERLHVHAIKAGVNPSELVDSLIQDHCRRWVVQDRGREEAPEACETLSAA